MNERYHAGIKRLSAVEVSRSSSNQHELNGAASLRSVLGPDRLTAFDAVRVDLRDEEPATVGGLTLTWYDARERHETRTEWRLYYFGEPRLTEGDVLIVLRRESDGQVAIVTAPQGSSWATQLCGIFGDPDAKGGSFVSTTLSTIPSEFLVVATELFAEIGWVEKAIPPATGDLETIRSRLGEGFPPTSAFSKLARELAGADQSDPDGTLYRWWQREEAMFRALEESTLAMKLATERPFADVTEFLTFSLTVQNRRKSRAGRAFENHVEALLESHRIRYERNPLTEGQRRPDFVLPGGDEYRDPTFPTDLLTVVGAKTTCKERWRQILDEAKRLKRKHLVTLEAAISTEQLAQMKEVGVQLVTVSELRRTYRPPPNYSVLTVSEFLTEAKEKQARFPC